MPPTPETRPPGPLELVVFADDWGRHPSSCQHLVRRLAPTHRTWWVNTIGMRKPTLRASDLRKITAKLTNWVSPSIENTTSSPEQPTLLNPRMYPGFRTGWQRRINAGLIAKTVHDALGPRDDEAPAQRVAVTTLPITADLVDVLEVDRWIYYCVDQFAVWPGLDGQVIQQMERELTAKADRVIVVNETLQRHVLDMGRTATVITHGIDMAHWSAPPVASASSPWPDLDRPIYLFWGLIDQRLDVDWCRALVEQTKGALVLVGPQQLPDEALLQHERIIAPGPTDYAALPALAVDADVLVMPYADLPVTRAMAPLKFKEYLATGKPVVARCLPAVAQWSDGADLVETADDFVAAVSKRSEQGVEAEQLIARKRLQAESWRAKADTFEQLIRETLSRPSRRQTQAG